MTFCLRSARYAMLSAFLSLFGVNSFAQFEARDATIAQKSPRSVALGDFNRDGKLDMAVASTEGESVVQVFLGNGDGTFQTDIDYPVGNGPNSLFAADFNDDGNLDLVVLNGIDDTFSVLLGRSDGTFDAAVNYATPPGPFFVTVADFNGDGKLDIATVNLGDSSGRCNCAAVFLGNGDGTFQESPLITAASLTPAAIGVGHFNGDGPLDLAVAEEFGSTNQVEIFWGTAMEHFA
jgi:hypothetical protein